MENTIHYDIPGVLESKTDLLCPFCKNQMIALLDSMTGIYTVSCEVMGDHCVLIEGKDFKDVKNKFDTAFL